MDNRAFVLACATLLAACAADAPPAPAIAPPKPATAERVPLSSLPLIEPVSIGARHHSMDTFTKPSGDVPANLDCRVDRKTGVVESCALIKEGESGYFVETMAMRLIYGARYDVSAINQASPLELRSNFPVVVSLANRRELPPPPARLMKYSEVAWVSEVKPESLQSAFFIMTRRKKPAMDIVVGCQIQADHSLLCLRPRADPPGVDLAQVDIYPLVRDLKAAPTLPAGGPSAGAWVELRYPFEAQAYDTVVAAPRRN